MILLKYSILFLFISSLIGCRKPIPEPHLNDYIYLDLKQELSKNETKLTEVKKEYSDFINKSKDPSLSISDIKIARAKADFTFKQITKLDQRVKYWKLKLLSREELVRKHYLSSFNKGEEWNNDEEINRYKKAKNWGTRLPSSKEKKPEKKNESRTENSGHNEAPSESEESKGEEE